MDFNALFPDEREKGETVLKQCQLVMLRMLKILDYLCEKHGISYFLNGGTLLGAIRHKGFIPWDDDLDIGMTRGNYEKFVKHVVPQLPRDIFFQSDETDPYFPACHIIEAKLRDRYSSYNRQEEDRITWLKWQDGLQIDIAVFDRAFFPHNFLIAALNRSLTFFLQHKGNKARSRVLKWISQNTPFPMVYASSFINGPKMVNEGSYYMKSQEISTLMKTKFEDMEAFIPSGWHNYLRRRYGNYMQPPPVKLREGHHGTKTPNPFKASQHTQILQWSDKR